MLLKGVNPGTSVAVKCTGEHESLTRGRTDRPPITVGLTDGVNGGGNTIGRVRPLVFTVLFNQLTADLAYVLAVITHCALVSHFQHRVHHIWTSDSLPCIICILLCAS